MPSYEGSYEAYASAGAEPAGAEPAGGTAGEPAGRPPGGFAGGSAGGSSWPAPSFSHRAALLILLLAAVILLRVVAAGKLKRAWTALTKASPSSSPSGSVAAGGGGSTVSGTTSSGQLNPRVFGVSAPLTGFGESSPTVAAADQAGLTYFGGGRLAHDYNFGAQAGTPIKLPLGERWKVLGDQYKPASLGGWGHLFGFEAVDSSGRALPGVLEFPHIDPVAGLGAGEILPGGTTIGNVGTLSQPTPYWTGPHLAVIVDEKMNSLLKSIGA